MGERIYTAEEAEALAAAATPEPWEINSYGAIMAGDTQVCTDCTYSSDERLILAAPNLARSVAHHARRADEAGEAMHDAQREIRRLRQGIAEVEMVSIPGENGEEELCPFCGATAWLLNRRSDQGRHRARCLWVWAQREVSGG